MPGPRDDLLEITASSLTAARSMKRDSSAIEKITGIIGLGVAGYKLHEIYKARRSAEDRRMVVVRSTDPLFGVLQVWLLDQIPQEDRVSLTAQSRIHHSTKWTAVDGELSSERTEDPYLDIVFDGSITQKVNIGGHEIDVNIGGLDSPLDSVDVSTTEFADEPIYDDATNKKTTAQRGIMFQASSVGGQQAVVAFLEDVVSRMSGRRRRPPGLFVQSPTRGWRSLGRQMPRPLDSVVLPGSTVSDVVADLERFYASEERYMRIGIPWHRGYLFSGPPGGGKSSLCQALGARFGLDTYIVSLNDIKGDSELGEHMAWLDEDRPACLLLEDVDTVSTVHRRGEHGGADAAERVTLSGLLNVLDGQMTPHGIVVMMTSNYPERLDEALLRPGRVDMHLKIGPVAAEQVSALFEMAYEGETADFSFARFHRNKAKAEPFKQLSAADVTGCIKVHLDDADDAHEAIQQLLDAPRS